MKRSIALWTQFVAVAEEGSFTRAAAKLRVAQPWLSTRLRELEEDLGFRLFDRSPRGVTLTAEGARFAKAVKALLRQADELDRLAAQIAGEAAVLRIGAIPDSFYIPERNRLLEAYREAFPDSRVQLENHGDPTLRRLVQGGELDFAFVTGTPSGQCEAVLVRRGRAELLLPAGHPLQAYSAVPLGALQGVRIAAFLRERNPVAWAETAGRLAQAGAQIVGQSESLREALVAQAVREGLALLVLDSFDDAAPDHAMSKHRLADASIGADFFLMRRKTRQRRPAAERFWALALAQAKSLAGSTEQGQFELD